MTKSSDKLLLASVENNFYLVAEILLENMYDLSLNKALAGAVKFCSVKFIQLLIDYGADIHTEDKFSYPDDGYDSDDCFSIAGAITGMIIRNKINEIKYLLESGIKFNSKNIIRCIYSDRIKIFCLLINYVDLPSVEEIKNALVKSNISTDRKKIFMEELIEVDPTYELEDL